MALQFEARKVALKQDRTGYVLTLSLHPDEIPEELLRDFVGSRYAVALVRIQDNEEPTQYDNRVKQSAILSKSESFQSFIGASSEEEAARAICAYCQISSRSELNGNKAAWASFDKLVGDFEEQYDPFS
jgi:hypothetical protein